MLIKTLERKLQFKPNIWIQVNSFIDFATILSVNTTAFIVPLYGKTMKQ